MQIEVRKPSSEEIKVAQSWPTWSKEPSSFPWNYTEKETCYILSGKAEVTAANGETAIFGQGDWVVFAPGLDCTWHIRQTIEKKYYFGD